MPRNKLSAILFDFDGTLTKPGLLNFAEIRAALRCPPNETILEYISSLPDEPRKEANRILEGFEMTAACEATPNRGAEELIEFLRSRRIPFGIITRNRLSMVLRSLENFPGIRPDDFSVILSRDDIFAPKPDPEGIRVAAAKMGVPVEEVLVVGDFRYDIQAGERAGATTVLLTNGDPLDQAGCSPDFRLADLDELRPLVRRLFPLDAGKVPNDLLEAVLGDIRSADPTVLVPPGIGQDAAALLFPAGEEVLILKSDPITFATGEQGFYAVVVNANDVVTMGAIPRWFLATLLLPAGSTAEQAGDEIRQLHRVCADFGVTLVGGHTEVTPAVNQPVMVGCLAGTAKRETLLRKEDASEGDVLLLTKAVAVEATALLAREFGLELAALGVSQQQLQRCRRFLFEPGISVVPEGRIAIENRLAVAMHDVTEGGLATALEELSRASGRRIRLLANRIPVFADTKQLCGLIGLEPLGLIGSGSLLIVCRADRAEELQGRIRESGIQVTAIGEMREPGYGIEAMDEAGQPLSWPHFEVDEIARAKAAIEAALANRL
ncbi:MAG: HAD family hydrolase [Acidobacteria bacterium]|nr:MAG: HAD family hydrolase [Acidobacteriota bacterium]